MTAPANLVFIATSLDGYIADRDGGLDWLSEGAQPDEGDHGYGDFIAGIDAIVMGRVSFETVLGFGGDWPYELPVFVLSRSLDAVPAHLTGKVEVLSGTPPEITADLNARGYSRLYIDGGAVIRDFLRHDMIDRMILSRLPILLGGGAPLFGDLDAPLSFRQIDVHASAGRIATATYDRVREAA